MVGCYSGAESESVAGGGGSDVFSVIGEENDSVPTEQVATQIEQNGGDASTIREQSDAVGKITLPNGNVATGSTLRDNKNSVDSSKIAISGSSTLSHATSRE